MFDDKDYEEVFYKDDRNKQDSHQGKKRNNIKETIKRQEQILKREQQCQLGNSNDSNNDEGDTDYIHQKEKKYTNGKAPRVEKEVDIYIDTEQTVKKGKKKGMNCRKY